MIFDRLLIVCLPPGTTKPAVAGEIHRRLAPFDSTRPGPKEPSPVLDPTPAAFLDRAMADYNHGLDPADPALTWAQVATAYNRRAALADPGSSTTPRLYLREDGQPHGLTTANPNGKFRRWSIGESLNGHFLLDPDNQQFVLNARRSGLFGDELACDGGPIGRLDLAAMRAHGRQVATLDYDEWEKTVADTPPARLLTDLLAERTPDSRQGRDRVINAYRAQPRLIALAFDELANGHNYYDEDQHEACYDAALAQFQAGRERYTAYYGLGAVPGDALLTLDGTWLDAADDAAQTAPACVAARWQYLEKASAYLDRLDPEAVLVAVDLTVL